MFRGKSVKILCSLFFIFILLLGTTIAEGQTITMKYSDHDPPGGMRTEFLKKVWFSEIIKETGGKVKFQDFWGGALLSSKEILRGVGDGVTNFGFVYPGHYPGELVALSIFKTFPKGPSKFETMAWLYRKIYDEIPEFKAELTKANQMVLLFTAGLPGAFTGRKTLRGLDDLKGDKWRAPEKWTLRFLKTAGAVPVSVPWDDVYMALQTGTIDGCFANYDGLHMRKLDEVAPNLLVSKELWFAIPFIHNVNINFWKSLPKDIQEGILRACKTTEQMFAKVYDETFDKIMATQKAAGYRVTVMSKEDVLKWENPAESDKVHKTWVEESVAAGMKTAPSVMEKMKALHKQAIEREK